MYKLTILVLVFFTGCSTLGVNAAMCEKIANDPHDTLPKECRNYVEEEAEKASQIEDDVLSPADAVEFTK